MRFPPPTAAPEDIVKFIDALEDECYKDPNRAAWQHSKQRWLDLYTGNHFADPLVSTGIAAQALEPEQLSTQAKTTAICKLVYNRVMNAVLAMLAGQISNPPKVVFTARENGEPPIYYLNGFVQNPLLQQIAQMAGMADPRVQELDKLYGRQAVAPQPSEAQPTDGPPEQPQVQQQLHPDTANAAIQAGTSVPLPPELVAQVQALIDQGKMLTLQARMAGMPPPQGIVPPEALVEITDQTAAQFTQTVFDALWEQCGGLEATSENILNKKVLGWQPTLFEADRSRIDYGESPITLTNMEGTQVFYDPMTSSFRPPRYAIMKEPVSYEEAIARFSDLDIAGKLADKFKEGTLNYRARDGTQTGRLFYLQYSRDMCVVRTLWYRDWPYPMDPDEAVACGKVSVQSIPTGQMEEVPDMATGTTLQRPLTRQTMVSQETGEQDVVPGHPSWPIIYAIREVQEIEGEPIFDRRCKLPTIPLPNNINIPIPFSPYGYGEPDRLDGLQMAINRVLSDMVTHHRYNTYPPEVAHESVMQMRSGEIRKLRMQPGSVISATREMAADMNGDLSKLVQYVETPPMPADAWKLLEFLVEAIDKEANNTDVQQGEAPAGSSGAWVANLQAAASQVAQVTSQSTEAWLKQIVRLIDNFITNDMTVQDVQKYCNKYPPAILDAFKQKKKALYLDVGVAIQSGSAAAQQGQTQSLVAAKQSGVMVSDTEILNRLGVDADDQLKQQAAWQQKLRESGVLDQMAENENAGANNQTKDKGQVNAAQQTPQG